VRKVLREAGFIVTDEDAGGVVVAAGVPKDVAIEILEAMKEEEGRHDGPPKPRAG
jgi:hypothetical protein